MSFSWIVKGRRMVTLLGLCSGLAPSALQAQQATWPPESVSNQETLGSQEVFEAEDVSYLASPRFKIPFNVRAAGTELSQVQLWVSTDDGQSWQMHGGLDPSQPQFEFRAAAEGMYLFSVRTIDARGVSFPSKSPPLRVCVDTTQPAAEIRADLNASGQLAVDIRLADEHLLPDSAVLRMRTDQESTWKDVGLTGFTVENGIHSLEVLLNLPPCREVGLVLAVYDKAGNVGEASFQYTMPRTASGDQEMTLASNPVGQHKGITVANPQVVQGPEGRRGPNIPDAVAWTPSPAEGTLPTNLPAQSNQDAFWAKSPSARQGRYISSPNSSVFGQGLGNSTGQAFATSQLSTQNSPVQSPGRLATNNSGLALGPSAPMSEQSQVEELPLPVPFEEPLQLSTDQNSILATDAGPLDVGGIPPASTQAAAPSEPWEEAGSQQDAYHCRSQAFSLDYSVEALGGTTLSEVELWGTEDSGQTWQLWGSDPDRHSPFDVRVGNDGLFGFRMVIVGANGVVSNRPRSGDEADAWIYVDTATPTAKITRAVYGQGAEEGMLVINYDCADNQMVERPIALYYSERVEGPWETIATGLENTGTYTWRPGPNIPQQIYLRVTSVDKAGNVGEHRLDAPINTRGLAPRGRIQGFRPILGPNP